MKRLICLTYFLVLSLSYAHAQNAQPPMMGWNSWNAYMVDISDSIIMNAADLMIAKGLKDAGYDHVNIDDGFFGGRDSTGRLMPHPTRFPNGMKHVPEYIHRLGMKAGIYSDAGHNTCGSNYNKDPFGKGVGLWRHDAVDAERYFNDWGFDFIKIDYCGASALGLDEKSRYESIRQVIDSVAHKHIDINVCRWAYPGTWVNHVGSSWRTSHDIRPNWKSIKEMVELNLYLSAYASYGHYNDMDMMVVGYNGGKDSAFPEDSYARDFGLTYQEEEAHFALWCIMSSPLLIGCDLTYIPEETLKIITNKELIAVNQDRLGLQAHVIQHIGDSYVLAKDLMTHRGKTRAIALYNPSEHDCRFSVPATIMGFEGKLKIRDLNKNEDLPDNNSIDMVLPPHSAKVLKVKGKRIEPDRYEAEWGYCPDYTAIRSSGVKYIPMEGASCGAVAMNIGAAPTNYLEWDDIYSRKGGKYSLTVRAFPTESTSFDVLINGIIHRVNINADCGATAEPVIHITLNSGENVIRLSGSETLPPVDYIKLERL